MRQLKRFTTEWNNNWWSSNDITIRKLKCNWMKFGFSMIWCQWLRFNAHMAHLFSLCYPTNYRQLSFSTKIISITFNVNHFVFWNVNKNAELLDICWYQTYLFYKSNCSGFEICMHSRYSARKMRCGWWAG